MGTRATSLILSFGVAGLLAQDIVPPMPAPKLGSTDPVEVSWAAWQAGAKAGDKDAAPGVVQELRIALGRLRHARDEASQYAVLQILHALVLHGADLPAGELDFEAAGLAWLVRVELLRKSRDPRRLDLLFHEWMGLDSAATPMWSVLGRELVAARHRGACQQVLDQLHPRLVVLLDDAPWFGDCGGATCQDGDFEVPGQPPLPVYSWDPRQPRSRQPLGVQFHARRMRGGVTSRCVVWTAADAARLSWVAEMAGQPSLQQLAGPLRLDRDEVAPAAAIAARREQIDEELAAARRTLAAMGFTVAGAVWQVADDRVEIVDRR